MDGRNRRRAWTRFASAPRSRARRQRLHTGRTSRFAAAVAAALAATIAVAQPVAAAGAAPRADAAQVAVEIVERSNAFRATHGKTPTVRHGALDAAARRLADYMADTDRYGHRADGSTPAERTADANYAYCSVAENIAYQFNSAGFTTEGLARGFVDGWIDSPPHRKNLLDDGAIDTGVAVAQAARSGRWYAVQLFARPAALRLRFEIANRSDTALRYTLDGTVHDLPAGVTRWHEQCDPPSLALRLPGDAAPLRRQPADGARYRVEPGGDGLRLVEE